MRNKVLGLLLFALLIALGGCKDLLTKHDQNFGGVGHGYKINYSPDSEIRGAKNCTACHGIALNGNAFIPGCYDCHDALWSSEDHNQRRSSPRGSTLHRRGSFVVNVKCAVCHGPGLVGGLGGGYAAGSWRPACTTCHGDNWTRLKNHTSDRGGFKHEAGMWNVETGAGDTCNAGNCHGTTLAGNAAQKVLNGNADYTTSPSCLSCHGARWEATGHTLSFRGVKHKSGLYDAVEAAPSDCGTCHDAGATAGTITITNGSITGAVTGNVYTIKSCYNCHGTYWLKNPHTSSQEGVGHAAGLNNPNVYCAPCHGAALTGNATRTRPTNNASCYKCHGQKW